MSDEAVRMNVAGMTTISKRELTALRAKLTEVERSYAKMETVLTRKLEGCKGNLAARDATIAELRKVLTRLIPSDEQIEHTKATADARAILKSSEPK